MGIIIMDAIFTPHCLLTIESIMESFHPLVPSLMLQEYPSFQRRKPRDDVHHPSFQGSMDTTTTIKHFSGQGTPEQDQDLPLKSMDITPSTKTPASIRYNAAMIPFILQMM
jgi:hypothetical protein